MKKSIIIVLLILTALFMLPLASGILHIGMIYPSIIFLIATCALAFSDKTKALFHCKFKILIKIFTACVALGMIVIIVILCTMGIYAAKKPPQDATVIVLGCQVKGDNPSRMLYGRMNGALKYLTNNPKAYCIASGGQGSGENISEAQAIYNYLVSKGIKSSRIYIENKSLSTYQNIEFSAKIIKDNGLNTNVAIASDNFHQLRASMFASKNGLTAYSLGCKTFWVVKVGYWAREVIGVARAAVLGY